MSATRSATQAVAKSIVSATGDAQPSGGGAAAIPALLVYDRNTTAETGDFLTDGSGNGGSNIRLVSYSYRDAGYANAHPDLKTVQMTTGASQIQTIPTELSSLNTIAMVIAFKSGGTLGSDTYYMPIFERGIALRIERRRRDPTIYAGGNKTVFANAWYGDNTSDWFVATFQVADGQELCRLNGVAQSGTTSAASLPTARSYMFGGGSIIDHAPFIKFGEMRFFDMSAEGYSTAGLIAHETEMIAKWL